MRRARTTQPVVTLSVDERATGAECVAPTKARIEALRARMRTPGAGAAVKAAFAAGPDELGAAALSAARRRR